MVRTTDLPGVIVIQPKVFEDESWYFMEIWHAERYREAGIDVHFVQSNQSCSRRGVLRGLHYQLGHPRAKLVRGARGEVFDVAVDVRRGSPTFGRWVGEILSDAIRQQMFIPEGFAHGFYVLSEADFLYDCSDYYAPAEERGVCWDDPDIGIAWPAGDRVVGPRDRALPLLRDAEVPSCEPVPGSGTQ